MLLHMCGGQRHLEGVGPLLLSCGFPGWNLGHQAWWHVLYTLSHFASISFLLFYILLNIFIHSNSFKAPQMNTSKIHAQLKSMVLTFSSDVGIRNTNSSI